MDGGELWIVEGVGNQYIVSLQGNEWYVIYKYVHYARAGGEGSAEGDMERAVGGIRDGEVQGRVYPPLQSADENRAGIDAPRSVVGGDG